MTYFDQLLNEHIDQQPQQLTAELKAKFRNNQVVRLQEILPFGIAEQISAEAFHLVEKYGERRDLKLAATGDTNRAYSSVSRAAIHQFDGIIPKLFQSGKFRQYLSEIVGETLHPVPYEPEEYIINAQTGSGDEHGWHFDDYSYALIWVAETPKPLEGGRVEYINFSKWDKAAPAEQLKNLLITREVRSLYIPANTFYLMKARYVMHRVTPLLTETARRTVVVYTFANDADLTDSTISHETMETIFNLPIETEVE